MAKVSVIGAGSWGTAIANVLAINGHDVSVYTRKKEQADKLNSTRVHENLPEVKIKEGVRFMCDIKETLDGSDVIVFAVPSTAFRDTVKKCKMYIDSNKYLVSLTKGMEDDTLFTMCEVIEDELKKSSINNEKIVALSGPTHAEEVAKNFPSTIVSASKSENAAKFVQDLFMNETFRVYTNSDIKGVEVCASFKNVIALAAGILSGLGYGDNIKASLLVRGLYEMTKIGEKLGLKKDTFYGLAGIGDMIVTATSMHSRNFRCGMYIGNGMSVTDSVKKVGMVVEGINFIPKAIKLRDKYDVELPITSGVAKIVLEGADPHDILALLMTRKKKSE